MESVETATTAPEDDENVHKRARFESPEPAPAAEPEPAPGPVRTTEAIGPILARVKIQEWQLFSPRLTEILEMEKEDKPLSPEIVQEKNRLFAEGFPLWERNDFRAFVQANIDRDGRETMTVDLAAAIPHKDLEDVKKYTIAFWNRGAECFAPDLWAMMMALMDKKKSGGRTAENRSSVSDDRKPHGTRSGSKVEDVEQNQTEIDAQIAHVKKKMQMGHRLEFHSSLMPVLGHEFCQVEDNFLLECFLARKSKEEIREAVLKSPAFAFDHFFRSLLPDELQRRMDTLVKVVEKDAEETAKIEAKAQRERERKEQEEATLMKRETELVAKIEEMEKLISASQSASAAAEEPGADTPHSPQQDDGQGDDMSDGGQASLDPKYHDQVLKTVIQSGTCGMTQLLDKVIRILPDGVISKRQLKKDILLLAVKEKRTGDRKSRWYPREGVVPTTISSSPDAQA